MSVGDYLFRVCLFVLVLHLTGCQKTLEDIEAWKSAGETAKLVSATGDSRQYMRLAAIEALAELKDTDAILPLTALFSDPDLVVVHEAVKAIASIGGPLTEDPLLAALKLKPYPARETAARALGELQSEKAVAPLINVLDDPYEEVALEAVTALGRIGDRAAIPALCEKMRLSSTKVKLACAKSLCQLGGMAATEGLVPAFAEINPEMQAIAVNAFIELGDAAIPYAYDALRGDSPQVQQCGLSILQGLDAVPTSGAPAIWYLLAQTSIERDPTVDPEVVGSLIRMGEAAVPALLEGVTSSSIKVRETTFLALESLGEPATAFVLAEAQSHASKEALEWLGQRNGWAGAPSWRLDLWGGATALSPDFKFETKIKDMLSNKGPDASVMIIRKGLKPTREYIPLLIQQFSGARESSVNVFGITIKTEIEISEPERKNMKLAVERLEEAGSAAVFPLIAGLRDPDPQISDGCAHVLGSIGDSRAVQPLLHHLERKIGDGESLTLSPFYTALQKLNDPSARALLIKVQPNSERAERLFRETYPDAEILHMPATNLTNPPSQPVAYPIEYIIDGQSASLTITFRETIHGDWIPHPPIPDSLPE